MTSGKLSSENLALRQTSFVYGPNAVGAEDSAVGYRTQDSSAELKKLERQLIEAESVQTLGDNEKEKVASALDILKEIIDKKELTHTDLAMLIDKIVVNEQKGNGLDYRNYVEYTVYGGK